MISNQNTDQKVRNAVSAVAKAQGGTTGSADIAAQATAKVKDGREDPDRPVRVNQDPMGHATGENERRRFGPNTNVYEPLEQTMGFSFWDE